MNSFKPNKIKVEKTTYYDRGNSSLLDSIADKMALKVPSPVSEPKIVVTIPAHNEEHFIANCLQSLADQRTLFGRKVDASDFEIIVLCHRCTDNTFKVCLEHKRNNGDLNVIVLETDRPEVGNVGAVRRILMRIARLRIAQSQGYIAMTDADTVVHPYWMANLISYLGSGYGLICGRINIDLEGVAVRSKRVLACKKQYNDLRMLLQSRFVSYASNPGPGHSDNSGPNMAVRADVYDRVGGMPPIGFCEDVAFYDSVVWGGHKVRHCPLTIVTTSGRIDPRAPWGFGAELSVWGDAEGNECEVEGCDALLARFEIYRYTLKYLSNSNERLLIEIENLGGIDKHEILSYIQKYGSPRAVLHKLEKSIDNLQSWRSRYPKISVFQAHEELKNYLSADGIDFLQT